MGRVLSATVAAFAAALAFGVVSASAEVVWLCEPGMKQDNPCEISQDTTRQSAEGDEVETPKPGPRKIDCFYVYPTVSNQLTDNADKARDPELKSIAQYQAARFSLECRVFAPVYRQGTLFAIAGAVAGGETSYDRELAYGDVQEAWRKYLKKFNDGRGVVLIGHSQGTFMLRELIAREIERKQSQRRKVVSSLLLGGNVTVADGETIGGDFDKTPLCTKPFELGCAVAYSTFAEDPPEGARFGTPEEPGTDIACTDPRKLARYDDPYNLLVPSEPFAPGPIYAGIVLTSNGTPPTADTTWVSPADRYEGGCQEINGANVLRLEPTRGSRTPGWFPEPGWGTHLIDVNATLDPLLDLVARQAQRWTDPKITLKVRCGAAGGMKLRLKGPEAKLIHRAKFSLAGEVVARDPDGPFRAKVSRRTLEASGARRVKALADVTHGESRRVSRSVKTCA
jgi:hypothetical protein